MTPSARKGSNVRVRVRPQLDHPLLNTFLARYDQPLRRATYGLDRHCHRRPAPPLVEHPRRSHGGPHRLGGHRWVLAIDFYSLQNQ